MGKVALVVEMAANTVKEFQFDKDIERESFKIYITNIGGVNPFNRKYEEEFDILKKDKSIDGPVYKIFSEIVSYAKASKKHKGEDIGFMSLLYIYSINPFVIMLLQKKEYDNYDAPTKIGLVKYIRNQALKLGIDLDSKVDVPKKGSKSLNNIFQELASDIKPTQAISIGTSATKAASPLKAATLPLPPPPASRRIGPPGGSPNLFPDADLTSLRNLDALNMFIGERFAGRFAAEDTRTFLTGDKVRSYFTDFKDYDFSLYDLIHSEGSNSDCLIHSFLTATCPNFRRLTSIWMYRRAGQDPKENPQDKNIFATWFRHYVLPSFPLYQREFDNTIPDVGAAGGRTKGEEAQLRIFTPEVFLSDRDLGLLCETYHVNFLSFEGVGGRQVVRLLEVNPADNHVYMVSNKRGAHFESVRTTEPHSYSLPLLRARQIVLVVLEPIITDAFAGMRNVETMRIALRDFPIQLSNSNNTPAKIRDTIDTQIDMAKVELVLDKEVRMRLAAENAVLVANVEKNSKDDYIRKRIRAGNATAFGFTPKEAEREFGAIWNAAAAQRKTQKSRNAGGAGSVTATLNEAEYALSIVKGEKTLANVPSHMRMNVDAMVSAMSGGGRKCKTRKPRRRA